MCGVYCVLHAFFRWVLLAKPIYLRSFCTRLPPSFDFFLRGGLLIVVLADSGALLLREDDGDDPALAGTRGAWLTAARRLNCSAVCSFSRSGFWGLFHGLFTRPCSVAR